MLYVTCTFSSGGTLMAVTYRYANFEYDHDGLMQAGGFDTVTKHETYDLEAFARARPPGRYKFHAVEQPDGFYIELPV